MATTRGGSVRKAQALKPQGLSRPLAVHGSCIGVPAVPDPNSHDDRVHATIITLPMV